LQTGLKLQEEAVRSWSSLMYQTPAVGDLRRSFSNYAKVANSVLLQPKADGEVLELVEKTPALALS